jgi:hypothetical protein
MNRVLLAFSVGLTLALPRPAAAQPPDPDLLERLSHHVKAFDEMGRHASLKLETLTEELDGSGKVSSTETRESRVEADGKRAHEIVEHAVKDGRDVTAEEQEKVKKHEEEAASKKKEEGEGLSFPFASDAYVYDQVGMDAADPLRVEISFTPKSATRHTLEGRVWVDTAKGTILSGGAKLSKPPAFVDWVHFTVELGAKTPLGPAISHLTFEVKGGLLFIRKHIRGDIKMSDYRWAP